VHNDLGAKGSAQPNEQALARQAAATGHMDMDDRQTPGEPGSNEPGNGRREREQRAWCKAEPPFVRPRIHHLERQRPVGPRPTFVERADDASHAATLREPAWRHNQHQISRHNARRSRGPLLGNPNNATLHFASRHRQISSSFGQPLEHDMCHRSMRLLVQLAALLSRNRRSRYGQPRHFLGAANQVFPSRETHDPRVSRRIFALAKSPPILRILNRLNNVVFAECEFFIIDARRVWAAI
jgi:hypothetical protein